MNWTGGRLRRHSKDHNSLIKAQAQHFANAQLRLHKGFQPHSPFKLAVHGASLGGDYELWPHYAQVKTSSKRPLADEPLSRPSSGRSQTKRVTRENTAGEIFPSVYEQAGGAGRRSSGDDWYSRCADSHRIEVSSSRLAGLDPVAFPGPSDEHEINSLRRKLTSKEPQTTDDVRRSLLKRHDWVGISVKRPVNMAFESSEQRQHVAKRRRITEADRARQQNTHQRHPSQPSLENRIVKNRARNAYHQLRTDDISIRIGDNAQDTPATYRLDDNSNVLVAHRSPSRSMLLDNENRHATQNLSDKGAKRPSTSSVFLACPQDSPFSNRRLDPNLSERHSSNRMTNVPVDVVFPRQSVNGASSHAMSLSGRHGSSSPEAVPPAHEHVFKSSPPLRLVPYSISNPVLHQHESLVVASDEESARRLWVIGRTCEGAKTPPTFHTQGQGFLNVDANRVTCSPRSPNDNTSALSRQPSPAAEKRQPCGDISSVSAEGNSILNDGSQNEERVLYDPERSSYQLAPESQVTQEADKVCTTFEGTTPELADNPLLDMSRPSRIVHTSDHKTQSHKTLSAEAPRSNSAHEPQFPNSVAAGSRTPDDDDAWRRFILGDELDTLNEAYRQNYHASGTARIVERAGSLLGDSTASGKLLGKVSKENWQEGSKWLGNTPLTIRTSVNTTLHRTGTLFDSHTCVGTDPSETDFLSQLSPMTGNLDERLIAASVHNNAPRTIKSYIQLPSLPPSTVGECAMAFSSGLLNATGSRDSDQVSLGLGTKKEPSSDLLSTEHPLSSDSLNTNATKTGTGAWHESQCPPESETGISPPELWCGTSGPSESYSVHCTAGSAEFTTQGSSSSEDLLSTGSEARYQSILGALPKRNESKFVFSRPQPFQGIVNLPARQQNIHIGKTLATNAICHGVKRETRAVKGGFKIPSKFHVPTFGPKDIEGIEDVC